MPRAYWRLLRSNRNFRRLWVAQIISEIGDWFYVIAIYSLLTELTGKAQALGLAVVLQVLPSTFVGPVAGVINDRLSRKKVMIAADIARTAIVLGMLLVRSPGMVWLAFVLLLLETVMWAFFEPARSAVIPNITSGDELIVANTLSSVTWSFNLTVGSALGGLVAVLLGRDAVFVLNGLSFLASAVLLRGMQFAEPHAAASPPLRADLFPIVEGLRYIRKDPRLMATVFVKSGVGFLGCNLVLLPLFGERIFPVKLKDPHRGAMLGMSLLMGARGVGALIGPFISGAWASRREHRMRAGILLGFIAASIGYVTLGLAPSVWLAVSAVMLAHAGGSTAWVFSTTLLQMNTEDQFRGRVFSADLGLCMLLYAISSYLAGICIDGGVAVRTFAMYAGAGMLTPALAWGLAQRLWQNPEG